VNIQVAGVSGGACRGSSVGLTVKKFDEDTLRIWVGADGWPLASERTTHVKVRFMLMGFTSDRSTKST